MIRYCSNDSERESIENKIFAEITAIAGGNQFVSELVVLKDKPGGEKNIIWFTSMDPTFPESKIFQIPPIDSKIGNV